MDFPPCAHATALVPDYYAGRMVGRVEGMGVGRGSCLLFNNWFTPIFTETSIFPICLVPFRSRHSLFTAVLSHDSGMIFFFLTTLHMGPSALCAPQLLLSWVLWPSQQHCSIQFFSAFGTHRSFYLGCHFPPPQTRGHFIRIFGGKLFWYTRLFQDNPSIPLNSFFQVFRCL